jgi:hypothetical protein
MPSRPSWRPMTAARTSIRRTTPPCINTAFPLAISRMFRSDFSIYSLLTYARPFSSCIHFAKMPSKPPPPVLWRTFIPCICLSFLFSFRSRVTIRPGRYDAGVRHCTNCPGFEEMAEYYCGEGQTLIPVEVTRGEFEAVLEFRRNAQPDEENDSPAVLDATLKVLAMIRSQTRPRAAPASDEDAEVVTTDAY